MKYFCLKRHACATTNCQQDIDFVVPDHLVDAAFQALKDAGFSDSKDPKDYVGSCTWHNLKKEELTSTYPYPARWLHLHPNANGPDSPVSDEAYINYLESRPHSDICLHPKSFALWALPDMTLEDPAPDDPNYMLANDPRLPEYRPSYGQGRFVEPDCRLQIPTPTRFTESLFLFMARERNMLDRGEFWLRYLCYIDEYVYKKSIDEDFLSPATMDKSLGRIWRANLRGGIPMREFNRKYIDRLRHNLIQKGVLPETAYPGCLKHDEVLPFMLKKRAEGSTVT